MTARSDRDVRREARAARLAACEAAIVKLEGEHRSLSDRVQTMRRGGFRTSAEELEVKRVEVWCKLQAARRELKRVQGMP